MVWEIPTQRRPNLRNMRQFYLAFPKRYTLCSELR